MTNYDRLFGTVERAAHTIEVVCKAKQSCEGCDLYPFVHPWCDGTAGTKTREEWLLSETCDELTRFDTR